MADSTKSEPIKRQYADEKGTYVLPNDAPEHDRLDDQSRALVAMMHNKPFHAPLANRPPKRILDIGCGTGAMTYLLALAYPDAEVIGLDISPVPERYEKPANLTYVQGDVMKLSGSEDARFKDGTFDYVFHRLLVLGMTDWPGYAARVATLLAPGGWAEMQDYDMSIFNASNENVSDGWWHWQAFKEDSRAIGLDTDVGRKLGAIMREAGLASVEEKMYYVPCCYWEELAEEQKPVGKMMQEMVHRDGYARALMERVSKGRRGEEELEKMILSGEEKYASVKVGDYARMGVAWGQKAA